MRPGRDGAPSAGGAPAKVSTTEGSRATGAPVAGDCAVSGAEERTLRLA